MKILYYSPHPHLNLNAPAGYATHMRETIVAMRSLGHEVETVINGGEVWAPQAEQASKGWKRILKKLIPKIVWETLKDKQLMRYDQQAYKRLLTTVEVFQPDVIYERFNYAQNSGFRVGQDADIIYITEVNSPYLEERIALQGRSWMINKAKGVEQEILEGAHRIIVVSSALKAHFLNHYVIAESKIEVVPNAVPKTWLNINQSENDEPYVHIGFVGSLFPWHGVDLLIRAFGSLATSEKKMLLTIVGDGSILAELKEIVATLKLSERIKFTGSIPYDEMPNQIACFDICVMGNSNWYGSPVKIFEYGAMGKAIIAPNKVPVLDVMEHNKHGLVIEPSVENIKTALQYFIDHPNERQEMALAFQKKVHDQHTWEANVIKMLKGIK